jgi:hypothetical protein
MKNELLCWEINIRKADNGFICFWKEETEEGCIKNMEQVFEEEDGIDESGELKNMINLLNFVKKHFAVIYSKHNKYNIKIKLEGEE